VEHIMFDNDLYGDDDEFGVAENRVQRLLQRKAKLQALMTVSGPRKQAAIRRRLERIDAVLAKTGYTEAEAAGQLSAAAAGIEGIGGLMFQAQSPPGLGRLLRLPFYPVNANTSAITSNGAGVSSSTNPVVILDPALIAGGNNTSGTAFQMLTPQISWATLRVVGFESAQRQFKAISNPGPTLLVQNLKIGGGANLFTHEQFADARIYDADQPEFCGLRDYPILKSPNQAEVTILPVNSVIGETNTVSLSLLCEVLVDDNYGAHVPGPYSRKGALVRQGGSFI
jgi:hypothetical protein